MTFRNACLVLLIPFFTLALMSGATAAGSQSLSNDDTEALRESVRQSYLEDHPVPSAPVADNQGATADSPPLITLAWNEQKIRVTDGTDLGVSIAVSGDTAFVGASSTNSYQGAVYVYKRSLLCSGAGCPWTQKQRLVASDATPNMEFGVSVAFDGTTAFVGATEATVDGRQYQGAVYVFTRDGSGNFVQVQKLTAADGVASDCYFGSSVAVVGTDALVGAPGCGGTNAVINSRGSAYRYSRDVNGTWTIAQKFVASDGGFAEQFGSAVAISAGAAMIGANSAFQFGYYGVGAVYVYNKQCFTNGCNPGWLETQKLIGSPTSTGMTFGRSIAFDGTTAVIGAEWALTGDEGAPIQYTSGAAYVFTQTNGQWTQQQQLLPSDAYHDWRFGASVAMSGNTLVVGACGAGWPDSRGAAYVFALNSGVWTEVQKLTASDGTTNDFFGNAVGIANDGGVLVGAPQGLNNSGQGTLYVYKQQ